MSKRAIKCPRGHTILIESWQRYGGVVCTRCRAQNSEPGTPWSDPTVYINMAPDADVQPSSGPYSDPFPTIDPPPVSGGGGDFGGGGASGSFDSPSSSDSSSSSSTDSSSGSSE